MKNKYFKYALMGILFLASIFSVQNVHAENYKNAAGRSGKEHDYFGDNVAGLCFFLQNFATLNILYYIIQQNPPQNKAVLLTYYKKSFGEGACGAGGD